MPSSHLEVLHLRTANDTNKYPAKGFFFKNKLPWGKICPQLLRSPHSRVSAIYLTLLEHPT